MSLEVTVKSASNLPNVERFSKSDPMTVLIFQGGHLIMLDYAFQASFAWIHCNFVCMKPFASISYLLKFWGDKLDYFCIGEKKKTKVIDNNLDPEWNQVELNVICVPMLYAVYCKPPSHCSIAMCFMHLLLDFADHIHGFCNMGTFLSVAHCLCVHVCIAGFTLQ